MHSENGPEPTQTEKKKDEYIVQTKQVIDEWGAAKDGKTQLRGTKIINGQFGPFESKIIAQNLCQQLACSGQAFSAVVVTLVDGPEAAPEAQVPPSQEVLEQMIRDGKLPGVKADAAVKTEAEPNNLAPFPTPEKPGETVTERDE